MANSDDDPLDKARDRRDEIRNRPPDMTIDLSPWFITTVEENEGQYMIEAERKGETATGSLSTDAMIQFVESEHGFNEDIKEITGDDLEGRELPGRAQVHEGTGTIDFSTYQ